MEVTAPRLAGVGRFGRQRLRALHRDACLLRVVRPHAAQPHGVHVSRRELRPRGGEAGVDLHCPTVGGERAAERVGGHLPRAELAPVQIEGVRLQALGGPRDEAAACGGRERQVERIGDIARDLTLDLEHVGECRVERLLPPCRPGARVDQLGAHAHPRCLARPLLPSNRAGQQVPHVEILGDLLGRLVLAPVAAGARTGDYLQTGDHRQFPTDLVRDAVGEVGVGRVAQVLEGQYGKPGV